MFELNRKVKELKPYDPITGTYRIRLDANESFITPTQEMKKEFAEAVINTHFNRYPDPYAVDVTELFAKCCGVPSNCVMAGNGSDEVISVIMNSFLQKGDTVVTLDRDFSMYAFYASVVECKNVTVPKNEDYTIDTDRVIETVNKEKARMLVFSNPCNPTSLVLDRENVRKIIKSVNALVVLDEAYMDFSDQSLLSEFSEYDNLIILKTCSKAIGMAALRLGFAVANETLINVLKAVKSPYNVNSVTQSLGSVVLSNPEYLNNCVSRIIDSRNDLYEYMKKIESRYPDELTVIKPETNFVFMKCKRAGELFKYLMSAGIIIRKMGDCLRITAGRNYENEVLYEEMEKFFKGEADAKG